MKRTILISILLLFSLQSREIETDKMSIDEYIKMTAPVKTDWDFLIQAIFTQESSCGKRLIGDDGKAVGPLQIHKVMVDEVNRIVGYDRYGYSDRLSYDKSVEMFNIYQSYYNPHRDIEIAARIWNGGPRGMKKHTTKKYYKKVKQLMS